MNAFIEIMATPFIACLILTGIHAYLGLHVIEREVIFVDLALAQVAALGATVGFLFGFNLHETGSYFFSLTFALTGAALFALSRLKQQIVPQEAIIGIVYAVSAAAAILCLSKAPDGGEELKALFVGHLLFVDWAEIVKIATLYSIIGIVHWIFRKQFLLISQSPDEAYASGLSVRAWDFLFYATFAFVVTSSTEVAGVLLVFSFLVVPAVCGALLAKSIRGRLAVGWMLGISASVIGMAGSYFLDLPTGAAVVCTFGFMLIGCSLAARFIFPIRLIQITYLKTNSSRE